MSVINISKQRAEELVSFVEFEKELFKDLHEVMKSVFEALN